MKRFKDAAFVASQHEDVSTGTLRINLKWQGNHEIFDFNLDQLGKVIACATETENSGWVMIEHARRFLEVGETIRLR
jgi:hypothetical protein